MKEKKVEDWIRQIKHRRSSMNSNALFEGLRSGNITSLSSAITLVESQQIEHREQANQLIRKCLPYSGNSIRVGITGVPGVGKSTFIEAFGKELVRSGRKIAVLTVDPSSSISGGSILGDKTRMTELSAMENVFIRPSAAGDTLGGVARKTRETIFLCEAAGFDTILIETVGVGQSETIVNSMVDFFLLLMLSGAGDELQGIKKGIMEMADALIITKADGDNEQRAKIAVREYKNAIHLFSPNQNEWIPKVFTCSSLTGLNIPKVEEVITSFVNQTKLNGWFAANRKEQDKMWLTESLKELLLNGFFGNPRLVKALADYEKKVIKGEISSFEAAERLYDLFLQRERV